MRIRPVAGLIVFLTAMTAGAAPPGGPAFEVATVRQAGPGEPKAKEIPANMDTEPGHFLMRNVPLWYAIQWAWDLKDYEIDAPDWIRTEPKYDIVGQAASRASDDQMRLMLRNLLIDRFQMKVRQETRNLDVYVLTKGKGEPKLQAPAGDEKSSIAAGTPRGTTIFKNQPLTRLALMLSRRLTKPTLDETGLTGTYDYTIDLAGLGYNGNPPDDPTAPSVFTTVQSDLGLRLEAARRPVQVLVIDHVEKVPTAN
ncbi:MAG TPA: TIGR03435 family protein [Bryobacteraceae bacterium]|nr:TIGR03435 family protein [Bryobacteraceae bacterium]